MFLASFLSSHPCKGAIPSFTTITTIVTTATIDLLTLGGHRLPSKATASRRLAISLWNEKQRLLGREPRYSHTHTTVMDTLSKGQDAGGESAPRRKSLIVVVRSPGLGTSVPETEQTLHDPWSDDFESEGSQRSDTDEKRQSVDSRASTPPPETAGDYELCIWCNDKATSVIEDGLSKLQLEEERHKRMGKHPHWRDEVERKLCAAYDAANTGISTTVVPSWWGKHARKDLPVGTIIDCPFHTPENGTEVDTLDTDRMATVCGIVHTKTRLMVVVKNLAMHAVCVPVYSHGGKGLAGKSAETGMEFVAVQNIWSNWVPENGHQALLAASHSGQIFKDKSYVKFTELRSHYYGAMCGLVGKMDDASTSRLLDLVRGALVG